MATQLNSALHDTTQVEAQLDRETELVRGAIRMVASGAAPRMTVAGIRFGEAVIDICRPMASYSNVSIEPIWHPHDNGCDVVVRERLHA